MKYRSARIFRTWYKIHHKKIATDSSDYEENFMGTYHDLSEEKRIKGFFEMFHGHKPDIAGYLPSILKIAEDGQAIYEFLQNAVDCHSSECHIFYDNNYFLAINNGRPFSINELVSLLNIAQSPKKDASQIGRFGVGFKLIHRLVGSGDGTNELVNKYKGPLLFSWSQLQDLQQFLTDDTVEYDSDFKNEKYPILLKILLTNFPADVEEVVKDISYEDRIVFSKEELSAMKHFMYERISEYINSSYRIFSQGSAFFLKLGDGKKELLDRNYDDLVNGIQYSMNILNLSRICINNQTIKKFPLQKETFNITCNSEAFIRINPEYKEFPLNITFGYPKDFSLSHQLKQSPNFYKYFPMGDEINGFDFIIHCDGFSNEVNRRKLQHDPINENLLPEIAKLLIARMEDYRCSQPQRFIQIYGNLLLSDVPDKQNNEWLKPVFYQYLNTYIRKHIPLAGGGWGDDPQKIKIKDVKLDIRLSDLGFPHYDWFLWDSKNKEFTEHARDDQKLGLEKWDIRDIAEQSDLSLLNHWIAELDQTQYRNFLRELNKDELRIATKERLSKIALFKFSDGYFHAIIELSQNDNLIFIADNRMKEIKEILIALNYITTDDDISEFIYLYEAIKEKCITRENKFFDSLAERCKQIHLTPNQKQRLIRNLTNPEFWSEIHNEKLGSLQLFCNRKGENQPLNTLLLPDIQVPGWLSPYKIAEDEYTPELDNLLVGLSDVYSKIILPNQTEILENVVDQPSFYQEIITFCQSDENIPSAWDKIFIDDQIGYVSSDKVFYHPDLSSVDKYNALKSAILLLNDQYVPEKSIVKYLEEPPFSLKPKRITELNFNDDVVLTQQEVSALLDLCIATKDNFFDNYIITKSNGSFTLIPKTYDTCQIRIAAKCRKFIEEHFSGIYYVLPQQFDLYRDKVNGIIEKDELYEDIVSRLDVDKYKEELTQIFLTESAKKLFLQKLKTLRLDCDRNYTDSDSEYTILEWACLLLKSDEEIENFRTKIIITYGNESYSLREIHPILDQISIEEVTLPLSKILPHYCKSIDHLNVIIENFKQIGGRINTIIGIQAQAEPEHYYSLLIEELDTCSDNKTRIINNTEQLIFVLLYQRITDVHDPFCIYTLEGDEYLYDLGSMSYSFVYKDFIKPYNIIDFKRYHDLEKYRKLLLEYDHNELIFLNGPLDNTNTILCDMILDDMNDNQRISLIEYLYTVSKSIDSTIKWNDNEAKIKILGFDPKKTIFAPIKYIRSEEHLPEYLYQWITADSSRNTLLSALEINCSESPLIQLRAAILDDRPFDIQDMLGISPWSLMQTLSWICDNKLTLNGENQRNILEKLFKSLEYEITISRSYDLTESYEELKGAVYESLKESTGYRIYLYDGKLISKVCIREFGDYVFCNEENNVAWLDDNSIFINRHTDLLQTLSHFIEQNNFPLKLSELYGACMGDFNHDTFSLNQEEMTLIENLRVLPEEKKLALIKYVYNQSQSPKETSEMQQSLKRYNQNSGDQAEQYVYDALVARYGANRVKWTSSKNPLNEGQETTDEYDYEVYDEKVEHVIYYIDCKSTTQRKLSGPTDIFWTESEWAFLENKKTSDYIVARVFDCRADQPPITYLHVECIDLDK